MSDTSIDDFEYDLSVKWWEMKPERVQCLFALDANAEILEGGKVLKTKSGPSITLLSRDGVRNTVQKVKSKGHRRTENRPETTPFLETFTEYRALSFFNALFDFENPITQVNDFTFILRYSKGGSLRSYTNNTEDPYAVVLSTSQHNVSIGGIGFRRGDNNIREVLGSVSYKEGPPGAALTDLDIDFLIVTYDSLSSTLKTYVGTRGRMDEVSVLTDLSSDSIAYDSKIFTSLGYKRPENNPDRNRLYGHVIALGLFDFTLTKEECFKILKQIDGEFLSENEVSLSISEKFLEENSLNTGTENIDRRFFTPYHFQPFPALKGEFPYKLNFIKTKAKVFLVDYEEPYVIKDVVTKEEEPTVSKLFLYEKYSGKLLTSTWSNEQGEFEFRGLNPNIEYIVHSYDKDLQYRSIIKDYN